MTKAVIFARVSSIGERQSTTRQVEDLREYANKNEMTVLKTFEEHISGAKKNKDREVLNNCLEYCIANEVDILLISELSRLGRNVDEVLASIKWCKDHNLNIYLQKENISIFTPDGKENPFLTIMVAVLGTASQLERENIYFRLKSGRNLYVKKNLEETGRSGLGRKVGYRKPRLTKETEYAQTLKLIRSGYPIRKVAKLTDVSVSTVKRLKKEFGI